MPDHPLPAPVRIGIVTVSDRAASGIYVDEGGPAIAAYLDDVLAGPYEAIRRLIPDERAGIEATFRALADTDGCALVLATGGTGPAPRDVTPEALEAVAGRMLPGFGEAMRAKSLTLVPTAILSRQNAGTRGRTLFITLPGKPSAIAECLDAVFAAVPYCLDLIGAARIDTRPERIIAFRPKGK